MLPEHKGSWECGLLDLANRNKQDMRSMILEAQFTWLKVSTTECTVSASIALQDYCSLSRLRAMTMLPSRLSTVTDDKNCLRMHYKFAAAPFLF